FRWRWPPTWCFMATTPQKRSKKSKVTPTASHLESVSQLKKTIASQEKTIVSQQKTIASQEKTIATQARELREALEQQAATSEILRVIASSPTDVQPVLDAIVESAARVCGIDDVVLRLREGNMSLTRAHFGSMPIGRPKISFDEPRYRWMREHGTLH